MAKIIVAIDIPGTDYKTLKEEIIDEKGKSSWYSYEDGNKVVIDEAYLKVSYADNSFYTFEVIDVIE